MTKKKTSTKPEPKPTEYEIWAKTTEADRIQALQQSIESKTLADASKVADKIFASIAFLVMGLPVHIRGKLLQKFEDIISGAIRYQSHQDLYNRGPSYDGDGPKCPSFKDIFTKAIKQVQGDRP